jgi:lactate racemase
MKIEIAYGKSGLKVELPDDAAIDVLEPKFEPGLEDQLEGVRRGLRSPIGTPPLAQIVKPTDRIGIVFSDISRATPYEILLPALLGELGAVPREQITLFNATGTHRLNTEEELQTILGPGIVGNYRIVQNDCEDDSSHRFAGTTSGGNDVYLLSEFLDCDVRILTGFIEPHFFAGFSGGGKAVMPGLALLKTVQRNHSAAHMDHPEARWGVTGGNPLWEEVREAARMAKPTFLLNISLNRKKEITAVFAGDFEAAHEAGCAYVKEHAMIPVTSAYDLVITGNSGYPLDLNMYQSVKGMSAASQIVKQGGTIIIAADCWDGIPDHGMYGRLLREADSLDALLARIRKPGFAMQDMWQAQIHALICRKAKVLFYSDNLEDRQIRESFMEPCRDIGREVRNILSGLPRDARICVLPEGPQTIPYIAE